MHALQARLASGIPGPCRVRDPANFNAAWGFVGRPHSTVTAWLFFFSKPGAFAASLHMLSLVGGGGQEGLAGLGLYVLRTTRCLRQRVYVCVCYVYSRHPALRSKTSPPVRWATPLRKGANMGAVALPLRRRACPLQVSSIFLQADRQYINCSSKYWFVKVGRGCTSACRTRRVTNCGNCRHPFGKQSATRAVRTVTIGMAHEGMEVLAEIGMVGHLLLSGPAQRVADSAYAADYSPGVSSKDPARPDAEEAGMVIKFRDKLDVVRSAILEETPSFSAGACQIDAAAHFWHELTALSVTAQAPGGLGCSRGSRRRINRPPPAGFSCKIVDQAGGKF